MTATATDPAQTPGAFAHEIARTIPGFGHLHFGEAPAGWLMPSGEVRRRDYRAYTYTGGYVECGACEGTGRDCSKSERGRKCGDCKGTGDASRPVKLVSVTTLIGQVTAKDGLVPWAEARGIEGAAEAVRMRLLTADTDPEEAVRIVRSNRLGADRARDDAADRGLNVHACLEHYMCEGEPPNPAEHPAEHHGYLRALTRWLLIVNPEPVAVEEIVADPAAGYAGRYDLCAKANGHVGLFDAKTQARGSIYPGAHLQLGLLRRGMAACGDGEVDFGRVVVFAADGTFAEMDQLADEELVDAAVDYARRLRVVTSACDGFNRAAWKAAQAA